MGLILDSSLLIAGEKEKFDLIGFLSTRDEPVVLAAITASELLHGCHRASSVQQKDNRMRYVEWALSVFEIVPFGLEEARHHAWVWSQLASITLLSIFLLRRVFFCKMGRRGVGRPTLATQH